MPTHLFLSEPVGEEVAVVAVLQEPDLVGRPVQDLQARALILDRNLRMQGQLVPLLLVLVPLLVVLVRLQLEQAQAQQLELPLEMQLELDLPMLLGGTHRLRRPRLRQYLRTRPVRLSPPQAASSVPLISPVCIFHLK